MSYCLVGCGGLGVAILKHLLQQVKIKQLFLVDFDFVSESNIQRICSFQSHQGVAKVEVLRQLAVNFDNNINIQTFQCRLQEADLNIFDFVVLVSADSVVARQYSVTTFSFKNTVIDAGIEGGRGSLRVFGRYFKNRFHANFYTSKQIPVCSRKQVIQTRTDAIVDGFLEYRDDWTQIQQHCQGLGFEVNEADILDVIGRIAQSDWGDIEKFAAFVCRKIREIELKNAEIADSYLFIAKTEQIIEQTLYGKGEKDTEVGVTRNRVVFWPEAGFADDAADCKFVKL